MQFPQKTNIILGNYIKNYISTQIFIEIRWPVDFRKDPIYLYKFSYHLFTLVHIPSCYLFIYYSS